MNRKAIYFIILTGFIVLPLLLNAQSNTMYYMSGVPQSYYNNPATQPGCNIFIGSPSSFQFNFKSSAFGFEDIIYKDSESDSVIYFLHSPADINKFLSKLDKVNYLSANIDNNLISFGFRVKEMYFTFDLSSRLNEKFSYPKDLAVFVFSGNHFGQVFDFSPLNFDVKEYVEVGIGISRKFGDQLSIGIRPKILFGISTISSSNTDITINFESERNMIVNANSDLNICTPGIIIPTNEDGVIDLGGDIPFDSTINSASEYIKLATGNKGFGIDFGLHYRPIDRLELSASVLDLGYIKWKNYTHNVSLRGNYVFEGVYFNSSDTAFLDNLKDSLDASFKLTGSGNSFKTTINPKIYAGGRYFLTPSFDVGALARFDFYKKNIKTDVILLTNWSPSTIWSVSATYNLLDGAYTTFGLGMSFRLGPVNMYIISDDIPTTYNVIKGDIFGNNVNATIPNDMLSYNLRFGLNLVFGCNKKKKLMKDKPMYYSDEY
jgi:hypothetical protein